MAPRRLRADLDAPASMVSAGTVAFDLSVAVKRGVLDLADGRLLPMTALMDVTVIPCLAAWRWEAPSHRG